MQNRNKDDNKALVLESGIFKTHAAFNVIAFAIVMILCALYTVFWNTGMIRKVFKVDDSLVKEQIIVTPKKTDAAAAVAAGETVEVSSSEIQ